MSSSHLNEFLLKTKQQSHLRESYSLTILMFDAADYKQSRHRPNKPNEIKIRLRLGRINDCDCLVVSVFTCMHEVNRMRYAQEGRVCRQQSRQLTWLTIRRFLIYYNIVHSSALISFPCRNRRMLFNPFRCFDLSKGSRPQNRLNSLIVRIVPTVWRLEFTCVVRPLIFTK